ncbi:uroporphyrinogen-III synthase [Methanocella sp. CWC-04]|uniref:Uroporphyrinogen-III synthase n=1 Tax=Methanooceanicella nereidis TaxID=2052831 RepID=A0AAP2RGA8_9EURY|nr:uroporphyrinogen-III synthase [Methanocella sp. CWC-04]MCD1296256.1 uroporphyrinogen-III synthase [Methanocella sp. CWC-04]
MKKIAVTRPKVFLPATIEYLRSKGLEPVPVPMMEMVPRKDGGVEAFISRLNSGDVDTVILTSQNGVRFIMEQAGDANEFIDKLNSVDVLAIGPKTNKVLAEFGIKADRMPSTFSSEGIVKEFCFHLAGKKVEVLRSNQGNPILITGLTEKGAIVKETIIYDIVPLSGREQEGFVREAISGDIDAFTFTSTMTAKSLLMMGESMGMLNELKAAINSKKVAVIGNPTADFLIKNGIRVDVVPEKFTFEDMIEELEKVL